MKQNYILREDVNAQGLPVCWQLKVVYSNGEEKTVKDTFNFFVMKNLLGRKFKNIYEKRIIIRHNK